MKNYIILKIQALLSLCLLVSIQQLVLAQLFGGQMLPNKRSIAPTIAISTNINVLGSGQGSDSAFLSFILSEASNDFDVNDVTVTGGTLSNFQGSGTTYTATFVPNGLAITGSVSVASGMFSGVKGKFNNDGADADNTRSFMINAAPVANMSNIINPLDPNTGVKGKVNLIATGFVASGINLSPSGIDTDSVPTLIMLSNGNFLVTWDNLYNSSRQILVSDGLPIYSSELSIGSGTNAQPIPLTDGGYVVTVNTNSGSQRWLYRYNSNNQLVNSFQLTQVGSNHDIVALADGGYVIVSDGSSNIVYAQRFDRNDVSQGIITVNNSGYDAWVDEVIATQDGGYIVTWTRQATSSSGTDLLFQKYNSANAPVGTPVELNPSATGSQNFANWTITSDGGYVVTWQDRNTGDIGVQKFDNNLNSVGIMRTIGAISLVDDYKPDVAPLPGGGFVVAWVSSSNNLNSGDTYVQRFDAMGVPIGSQIKLWQSVGWYSLEPQVIATSDGGFVVMNKGADTNTYGSPIYAQKFDSQGNTVGDRQIFGGSESREPNIIATKDGGYIVTWIQRTNSSQYDPMVQKINSSGVPVGATGTGTFKITSTLTGLKPTITINSYVATFTSGTLTVGGVPYVSGTSIPKASWDAAIAANTVILSGASSTASGFELQASVIDNANGQTYTVPLSTSSSMGTASTTTMSNAMTVDELFGTAFTDPNPVSTSNTLGDFKGVAITSAGSSSDLTSKGKYQILINGTWTDLSSTLSDSNAVFANKTTLVRFVSVSGTTTLVPQNLTVRLVDGYAISLNSGNTINVSNNGGMSAYSNNVIILQ